VHSLVADALTPNPLSSTEVLLAMQKAYSITPANSNLNSKLNSHNYVHFKTNETKSKWKPIPTPKPISIPIQNRNQIQFQNLHSIPSADKSNYNPFFFTAVTLPAAIIARAYSIKESSVSGNKLIPELIKIVGDETPNKAERAISSYDK
jgi:hypothetical protein